MAERFGNYEILRKLAAGGMAEVFLAKQTGIGGFERLVCVKRILPHLSEQEDFITMFQDEARIAAGLVHPNIAQIYELGQAEGSYYIAMEYVRGQDLRRVYNQEVAGGRAMPLEPAAQILMGAAAGLDYAHRQATIDGRPLGIVHRDISPQNLLVTYDGHVKIVDFGVAKASGKLAETRAGVLKGKYSYMSPEQASGDPIDARTDIFALGIVLYEVTTGVRLFKRETEIETLHAVIECKVTPPRELIPDYDPDFEAIVLRALQHDPDDRYSTAGEMARELEQFLVRRGHPPGASSLAQYMRDLFAEHLADEALTGGYDSAKSPPPKAAHAKPRTRSGAGSAPAKPPPPPEDSGVRIDEAVVEDTQRSHSSEPSAQSSGWSVSVASASTGTRPHDDDEKTVAERDDEPVLLTPKRTNSGASRTGSHVSRTEWAEESVSHGLTSTQALEAASLPGARDTVPVPELSPVVLTKTAELPSWTLWFAALVLIAGLAGGAWLVFTTVRHSGGDIPHTGELRVDSEPRGARVVFSGPGADELNTRYGGYRTPFTVVEGIPVETALEAEFAKDAFAVLKVQVPRAGEGEVPKPLFVELEPEAGGGMATLVFISTPAGAMVLVDGKEIGPTPRDNVRVEGGKSHKLEMKLSGYKSFVENLHVEIGARRFVEAALVPADVPAPTNGAAKDGHPAVKDDDGATDSQTPTKRLDSPAPRGRGTLSVSAPLPLKVYVDNRAIGETPIRKYAVDAGSHKLRFEAASEGLSFARKVQVRAAENEAVEITLRRGSLSVNATPWATVHVGSRKLETPGQVELFEGDYTLRFECPDGRTIKQSAKVAPSKKAQVSVNCRE